MDKEVVVVDKHLDPIEITETYELLELKLKEKDIHFTLIEHEPTKTSEESAKVRGTSIDSGAKAIIIELEKQTFCLMVMSASYKFSNKLVKSVLESKKIKFAGLQDVFRLTVRHICSF